MGPPTMGSAALMLMISWNTTVNPIDTRKTNTMPTAITISKSVALRILRCGTPNMRLTARFAAMLSPLAPMTIPTTATTPTARLASKRWSTAASKKSEDAGKKKRKMSASSILIVAGSTNAENIKMTIATRGKNDSSVKKANDAARSIPPAFTKVRTARHRALTLHTPGP